MKITTFYNITPKSNKKESDKSENEIEKSNTIELDTKDSFFSKNKFINFKQDLTNNFINKKRKRIKLRKISKVNNKKNKKTLSNYQASKVMTESKSVDNTNSNMNKISNVFLEESDKSLYKSKLKSKKPIKKVLAIKNIKTGKKIDITNLIKYKFPHLSQNDFNYNIYNIYIILIHSLYSACQICELPHRHLSMGFRLFQYHFEYIEEFLSSREIAHICAKMMEYEFRKIENSLQIFSELAVIYQSCEFFGAPDWRAKTYSRIEAIKHLNIEKKYFKMSKEKALKLLILKLQLIKNK